MIFVTGATGNVGNQVARILASGGVHVRTITRNPEAAHLPARVEALRGDFTDPETLARNVDGADAIFLMMPPSLADLVPVVEAVAPRVQRIVFLSSALVRDDDEQPRSFIAQRHKAVEDALKRSGVAWTTLRPGYFAANAMRFWQPQLRSSDVLRFPLPDARFAAIHERDIAEIAALALTGEGHEGNAYVLTGPGVATAREQLAEIARSTGRSLVYEEVTGEEALQAFGPIPPQMAQGILAGWESTRTAAPFVTNTVAEILGKPARSFAQWADDHADAFVKTAA
jgi:uncharacterized protein YbjT (DUF2867 family)